MPLIHISRNFKSSLAKLNLLINLKHNAKKFSTSSSTISGPGTSWNIERLLSQQRVEAFMNAFPNIVKDLSEAEESTELPDVNKHYSEVLRYVVPYGKRLRSYISIAAYETLEKNLTPENVKLSNVMAWTLEVFQGFLVMVDDIMDQAKVRRGAPCWHLREDVGVNAINDAFLVEQGVYTLLRKHFSNHHCYLPAVNLFHDISRKTSKGQALDAMNYIRGKPNLEKFTMERFLYIAEYKTGFYTFELPICLSMYMANIYDSEMHKQARAIYRKMSHFYQIQDDILDCWGQQTDSGKDKNDVKEGKCTWLAVMALQKATPPQRRVFELNFGRPEPECVNKVFNLFEEMGLPQLYASTIENQFYNSIKKDISYLGKNKKFQQLLLAIIESLMNRKC